VRVPFSQAAKDSCGSIRLEALVAVVLLSLLIVPLASGIQSGTERVVSAAGQAAALSTEAFLDVAADDWQFGARIEYARWSPGPSLELAATSGLDEACGVGFWLDGWLISETSLATGEPLRLASDSWSGLEGRELVMRARGDEGTWGPPWRTIVPDASGETAWNDSSIQNGSDAGEAAVHTGFACCPVVSTSWTGDLSASRVPLSPLVFPTPADDVACGLQLGGSGQGWRAGPGRMLDLYF